MSRVALIFFGCIAILEEIKAALHSSMERKVLSLDNDRWMFEGERGGKF